MLKLSKTELKGFNMEKKSLKEKNITKETSTPDFFAEYIETFKNAIRLPDATIKKFLTKYKISDIKEEATGKKLRQAVENNDIKKVLYYLEESVSPEGFGFDGNLLGIAIQRKYTEIMELLFAYGATITGKDEGKGTPIVRAVQSDSVSLVSLLLEKGADANFVYRTDAPDNDWHDPIHQPILCDAVDNNNTEICRLLLKYKANPNVCGLACCKHEMPYPLAQAVKNQNMELVYMLVNNGANINCGVSYQSPLVFAVKNNDVACAEYLLDNGADINIGDGWKPLTYAIDKDYVTMVKMLIARGANLDEVYDDWGNYYRQKSKFLSALQYAEADRQKSKFLSALQYAICKEADPEIIRVCRYPDEARKFYMKRIDPNIKQSNILQFKKAFCHSLEKEDMGRMSRLTFYNKMIQFVETYTGVKRDDPNITPLQAEIYTFAKAYIKEMSSQEEKTPLAVYQEFEKEVKQNVQLLNVKLQLIQNLQKQNTM